MVFKIPEAYAAYSTVFDACLSIDCENVLNYLTFCDVPNVLFRGQSARSAESFCLYIIPQPAAFGVFDVLGDKNQNQSRAYLFM